MNWLKTSNRQYHLIVGVISALIGTIIGAIIAATSMEGKDCQNDPNNAGIPPYSWTWKNWDWLDFLATVLGGLCGQIIQGVILLIIFL